jgi:hypothetical protein
VTDKDPYLGGTGRPLAQNVSPLRLQRFIVRIFVFLTAGSWRFGQLFYALFFSILVSYLFRRLLLIYGFGRSSLQLSILFTVFPLRFVLFRSLPTYDSLFLCLICAALILYRGDYPLFLIGTIVLASFVRFEAVSLFFVFAACYALAKAYPPALLFAAIGVAMALIVAIFYPDWRDAVVPNAIRTGKPKEQELVTKWPFQFFFIVRDSISNLRQIHTLHMIFFPPLFGSVLLLFQSMPLAIFGFGYTFVLSFIQSQDMNRFAIPVHAITLLTGCHFFLSAKVVSFVIICAAPVVVVFELYYCGQQINSRQLLRSLTGML